MIAKTRNIKKDFSPIAKTQYPHLLVSGASNTWNNSEIHACTWPYYLRDLCQFEEIHDCSQSGSGCNHVFNSIVNEIETNPAVNPKSTIVICLWPDMSRTDVINFTDTVKHYHSMSLYKFNDRFSTHTIFPDSDHGGILSDMGILFKKVVDMDAQIYESAIKIIALNSYLEHKGYKKIFLIDSVCSDQIKQLPSSISQIISNTLTHIEILENYGIEMKLWEFGHPNPDAHLQWTKSFLIPHMIEQQLIGTS